MDNIVTWVAILISIGVGVLVAIAVQIFVVPRQRKAILAERDQPKTTM
jgi:hypothetical protein